MATRPTNQTHNLTPAVAAAAIIVAAAAATATGHLDPTSVTDAIGNATNHLTLPVGPWRLLLAPAAIVSIARTILRASVAPAMPLRSLAKYTRPFD